MKKFYTMLFSLFLVLCAKNAVHAQQITYTVQPGDSLWKIAVKYEIGVSEIISANPQIPNPNMIMVGQKVNVPNIADIKALENEVIRLVNIERGKQGLAPVAGNWQLSRVARYKSADMRDKNYFSHYSPTYGDPFKMMHDFGITFYAAGENIAMGQPTPQSVMTAWMNSQGHRANILNPQYNEIGVGVAKTQNGTIYWTQEFIKR
ncbi:SCP-like protein [Clostridiales bacterium oral taxon 876 str. F0540]|nr:SCP-like protein [Clostridiales bacterium oral taxon 876 str. F0540]